MKRRYSVIGVAVGFGLTGLVTLPQAQATLPCGIYQNPNSTNSTGSNDADSFLNLNNILNLQGNNTSGVSNLLCGAKVGSGNRVFLFQDAPPSDPGTSGDLCDTNQNNNSTNMTGKNSGDIENNINNAANLQGNNTSIVSNFMCGARILSGNTLVVGGKAPAESSPSTPARRCLTTQGTWKRNSTGDNILTDEALTNVNNIGNSQGNNTSIVSNFLCDSDVGSGNTLAIGGDSPDDAVVASGISTTTSSPPATHCIETQQGNGSNSTGINLVSALLNLSNVGNSQGNNTSGSSNLGCELSTLSNNMVLANILSVF
jgi:hypothetical protein